MKRSEFIGQGASREAFGARLAALADQQKSVEQFARKIGVSPSALRKWLKGQAEPRRDTLVALARAAGVSVEWLTTGKGPTRRVRRPAEVPPGLAETRPVYASVSDLGDDYIVTPRRRATMPARGDAVVQSDQIVDDLAFRTDWVRRGLGLEPEQLLLIEVAEGSRQGDVRRRDLLLLDTGISRVRDGALYVLDLNGDLAVKRIRKKLDGTLVIEGTDADPQSEEVAPADVSSLPIVGRVVWVGRKL